MKIQQEVVDAIERIGDEALSAESTSTSRYIRMRKLARVARTWYTRPFKMHGEMRPCVVIDACDRKAFRRSFVEMMMRPLPIRCIEHPDGTTEFECPANRTGLRNAMIDSRGRVVHTEGVPAWSPSVSLAPRAITTIATLAETHRIGLLTSRFRELTGGKDLGHIGKVLTTTQYRFLKGLAIGAVRQFASKLDPEALRISRRLCLNEGGLVARLAHPDDTIALRWRQALEAYPALVLEAFRTSEVAAYEELCRVIESGQNLVSYLAMRYSTSEAVIRRYKGVLPQTIHRRLQGQRSYLSRLDIIGRLPVHLRPRRQKEHCLVMDLIDEGGIHTPDQMTSITLGMKKSLAAEANRIEELAGYKDVILSLQRALSPCDRKLFGDLHAAPIESLSLGARIRLNREWHRAIREASIQASLQDTGPVKTWPALLKGPVDLGQLVAVELTTSAELVAEGISMNHCVGGYTWHCMGGHSRIVSIRTKEGDPITTMEIGRTPAGGYVLRQNYTFGNRRAPKAAAEAAAMFMRKLRSPTVANKGPWPKLECEVNDRGSIQAVVDDALHAFWHARFPELVCSPEERRQQIERAQAEEKARREAWQAEYNRPENVAAREASLQAMREEFGFGELEDIPF